MAGLDLSQPLLGAGGGVSAGSTAAARARAGIDLTAKGKFKRGLAAEIGISAFANAAGEFSKFIAANIEGSAFAEAMAGIQLQLPLNLFEQFGFAAKAEAIAQAAAGVDAGLGISIGDFIELAKRDPEMRGLALDLLMMFLEEVSIGGVFEINAAVTAKAHASLTISGTVIEKAPAKAGFYFTVDAGVGLAAGVGAGLSAGAEFKNFRRFYGRAIDRAVDTTIKEIEGRLPAGLTLTSTGESFASLLAAFAPAAKIALRAAFELGVSISQNAPGRSAADRDALCNKVLRVFLEETQRFIFKKLCENGIAQLGAAQSAGIRQNLRNIPAEPFRDTPDNVDYWQRAVNSFAGLTDPAEIEQASTVYCAAMLLLETTRAKINTSASVYIVAAGIGARSAGAQFPGGNPAIQPPQVIRDLIDSRAGGSGEALTYADLAGFLASDLILEPALGAIPEFAAYVNIFNTAFPGSAAELLGRFIQNTAVDDPHATLAGLVDAIDGFISTKFESEMLPVILGNVEDENLRQYVREVLYGSVVYTKDVALRSVLQWESRAFRNQDFTEALSAVVLMLLGRTLVVFADTLMTTAQDEIEDRCKAIARRLRKGELSEARVMGLPLDQDLIALIADCVEIGGEVLGPLPDDTRDHIRNILYQVFEPVLPGSGQTFLQSLADDFFIPSRGDLEQLTDELVKLSAIRLAKFIEKLVLRMGSYALHELSEPARLVFEKVRQGEERLAAGISGAASSVKETKVFGRIEDGLESAHEKAEKAADKLSEKLPFIRGDE